MRKAVGDKRFTLANGFQHAKLKNRIDMMLQTPTSGWKRLSWLAILPFLAGTMFLCNPVRAKVVDDQADALSEMTQTALPDTNKGLSYDAVEVKPTFQGGDLGEFSKWVNAHLKYPDQAKKEGAQGRVALQFTVGADGVLQDVSVLRGVREDLDAEAVRVISASPKWEPGRQSGKAVAVTIVYPIVFQLR